MKKNSTNPENNHATAPVLQISSEVRAILEMEAKLMKEIQAHGHDAASREKKRLQAVAERVDSTIQDHEAWLEACEGRLEERFRTAKAMHSRRLGTLRTDSWPTIRPLIAQRHESNLERKARFDAELAELENRWGVKLDNPDPFRSVIYEDECRLRWPMGMTITASLSEMLS